MSNSTHDMSEKLVQYLDGELSGNEKELLEKQLASDVSLADELQRLHTAREAVRLYGLRQKVSSIHGEMIKEIRPGVRTMPKTRRTFRYSIAVAATVVLVLGLFFAYNFFTLSPGKVVASNYQSYELSTLRDTGSSFISPIEQAYREKKYADVVNSAITESSKTSDLFLKGLAYMELDDHGNAINNLRAVIENNQSASAELFMDEAQYYLALAYIKNKDYDPALDLLKKIRSTPGHIYQQMVTKKLIRQVRMLKWKK